MAALIGRKSFLSEEQPGAPMMDAKKVDVLAVIDSYIECNRADGWPSPSLQYARDAVAELIEAIPMAILELRNYRDDCEDYEAPELVDRLEETTDRLAKAYDRMGAPA